MSALLPVSSDPSTEMCFALRSEVSTCHALFWDWSMVLIGNWSLGTCPPGQFVGNSFAFPCEEHHVCKLDNNATSAAELGVGTKRVGGSSRVWSDEFVKERKFEPGDQVYAEFCLAASDGAVGPPAPTS